MKKQAQTEVVKSNPFITKSTSKTLLTPCRRVGLSRKRKTPNSSNNNSFSESVGDTSVSSLKTPESSNNLKIPEAKNDLEEVQEMKGKSKGDVSNSTKGDLDENIKIQDKVNEEFQSKTKALRKSRVSKRLIDSDDETLQEDSQNMNKRKRQLGAVTQKDTANNKVSSQCSDVETEKNQSRMKTRTSPRKQKEMERGDKLDKNLLLESSKKNTEDFDVGVKNKTLKKRAAEPRSNVLASNREVKIEEKEESENKLTGQKTETTPTPLKDVTNKTTNDSEHPASINEIDIKDVNNAGAVPNTGKHNSYNTRRNSPIKKSWEQTTGSNNNLTKDDEESNDFDFRATKCLKTYQRKNKNTTSNVTTGQRQELKEVACDEKPASSINEVSVPKPDKKSKKIRRSLSTKKSSCEEKEPNKVNLKECSVSLTSVNLNQEDIDVISELASNEIQELEKQIKEKHQLVDEFKQAEIIKKKHDLNELQELTARWKTGCISALHDLLSLLQETSNIDMPSLLKNFNIPQEMISVSDSGDLV